MTLRSIVQLRVVNALTTKSRGKGVEFGGGGPVREGVKLDGAERIKSSGRRVSRLEGLDLGGRFKFRRVGKRSDWRGVCQVGREGRVSSREVGYRSKPI